MISFDQAVVFNGMESILSLTMTDVGNNISTLDTKDALRF
jgi:hypothetical protein